MAPERLDNLQEQRKVDAPQADKHYQQRVAHLEERAKAAFGNSAGGVQRRIATAGSSIGPPWTKDHKAAALAALIVLSPVGTLISRSDHQEP